MDHSDEHIFSRYHFMGFFCECSYQTDYFRSFCCKIILDVLLQLWVLFSIVKRNLATCGQQERESPSCPDFFLRSQYAATCIYKYSTVDIAANTEWHIIQYVYISMLMIYSSCKNKEERSGAIRQDQGNARNKKNTGADVLIFVFIYLNYYSRCITVTKVSMSSYSILGPCCNIHFPIHIYIQPVQRVGQLSNTAYNTSGSGLGSTWRFGCKQEAETW